MFSGILTWYFSYIKQECERPQRSSSLFHRFTFKTRSYTYSIVEFLQCQCELVFVFSQYLMIRFNIKRSVNMQSLCREAKFKKKESTIFCCLLINCTWLNVSSRLSSMKHLSICVFAGVTSMKWKLMWNNFKTFLRRKFNSHATK